MTDTVKKLASRGIATEKMKIVSEKEKIPLDFLIQRVANGKIVIPRGSKRSNLKVVGVGEGLSTKVNVNVGSSTRHINLDMEVEKAKISQKFGADTIMDLSIGGDIDGIRRKLMEVTNLPFGTVPIYQAYIETAEKLGSPIHMSEDTMFSAIDKHFEDGVEFATVHTGITLELAQKLKDNPRTTGVVSRGGSVLATWMLHNGLENPFYKNFDYLVEMAAKHDVTLSLGDALRPGAIADAFDDFHISELTNNARLTKRAWEKGVQVMIEGPGHMPLNKVAADVKLQKSLSNGAPYYILGPLVTDLGPGYDHISSAIGAAIASSEGADLICYLTPAEHLSLPNVEQVKDGLIAARLAAHAGDIVKLGEKAYKKDLEMSKAKADLDWDNICGLSFDPEKASEIHTQFTSLKDGGCTMCGEMCVFLLLPQLLKQKK